MTQRHQKSQDRRVGRNPVRPRLPVLPARMDEDLEFAQEDSFAQRCRRFGGVFCVRFLVPVLMLATLAVGLGYFRLAQGPASLKFLVAPIERGIATELQGLVPKIDDVVVTLRDGGGFEFRLQNLRLFERDGELVASAPSAAMQLSASALWSMRVVPSKVVFLAPQVFMAYSRTEGLTLRFSQADGDVDVLKGLKRAPSPAVNPNHGMAARDGREGSGLDGNAAVRGQTESAKLQSQVINVARLLAEATERARGGSGASSYLREVGFRNASVVIDHEGHLSTWNVPRFSVDLDHRHSGSIVSGSATVSSARGPWTLSFRFEDSLKTRSIGATLAVRGFVPRTAGEVLPSMGLLKPFDMPVDGDATFALTRDGQLSSGKLDLKIGHGNIYLQALNKTPLKVDAGLLRLKYDGQKRRLVMEPSTLRWGNSALKLAGLLHADDTGQGRVEQDQPWRFDIWSQQGIVSVSEFGVPPLSIDEWKATGVVWPSRSLIDLRSFKIAVGGGEVTLKGEIDTNSSSQGTNLEGKMSAMPIATLKALWPRGVGEAARGWVGKRVLDGRVDKGAIKFISGRFMRALQPGREFGQRLALTIELSDIVAKPAAKSPDVTIPRALVRLENNALEIVVPQAQVVAGGGQNVTLKSGRLTAVNLDQEGAVGEVDFKVQTDVAPIVTLLTSPTVNFIKVSDFPYTGVAGKLTGDMRFKFPVAENIRASDVKLVGKLRLSDGRVENVFGSYDVQGATLDVDITESAVDARGEILLSGVVAKLNWQLIFGVAEDRQPPLRITATLDNSDRRQLGLEFDKSVHGDVPIELTITPRSGVHDDVHFRADLTNADLFLESAAWRKGPGRSAFLECDVVWGERYPLLLKNLKVAGDDIGVEGWAGVNEKNRVVAIEFPNFSLDLVSRLKVSGRLKKGKVWVIKAKGPTYDGKGFFRSLFSIGRVSGRPNLHYKAGEGVDISADIGTVLGFEDASLKNVKVRMSKRGGILTSLNARGTLSGGKPLSVSYQKKKGEPRLLVADSPDAGEVFRLVGFYPNLQGGRMKLKVQLDGRGPAEKTGTLWVDNFRILGDPIVSQVFSNAEDGRPSIAAGQKGKRRVVREVFPFDQMRAPFSVGHGQFVLEDAYVRGPVLGATLRGKVDYTRKSLNIGGTYVPLQGLNNAFNGIPLLGELLSGPRGEGIFGMTFAIQGAMGNPQVIVNPFSFVAPGILREIFQMTPYDPKVQPRNFKKRGNTADWDVRSSSTPAAGTVVQGRRSSRGNGSANKAVDGWSSQTSGQ